MLNYPVREMVNILLKSGGLTLVELMISVAVIGTTLTIGIPSYHSMIERQHLLVTTDVIYQQFRLARSYAIKHNQQLVMQFCQQGEQWKVGLTTNTECDCFQPLSCSLNGQEQVYDFIDGKKVKLESINYSHSKVWFSPIRLNSNGGTIIISTANDKKIKIITSLIGRIRICQIGAVGLGYTECI
ncbi:hypothetical protein D1Z90_09115 [Motilimonas pumila]|uniref:Type II secretion system protein H n=1 Tax=Motilimonas pumila TaxID=2303987 RepID=A0A418YF60_9GAMM|nr:hypothetical protein D1Z90_09115 [Motilimonas pumila]